MFAYLKLLFFDIDTFKGAIAGLAPTRTAFIRFVVALVAFLVNQGVLPGGDSATGAWASSIAMLGSFLISSGEKNMTSDEIVAKVQDSLRPGPNGLLVPK